MACMRHAVTIKRDGRTGNTRYTGGAAGRCFLMLCCSVDGEANMHLARTDGQRACQAAGRCRWFAGAANDGSSAREGLGGFAGGPGFPATIDGSQRGTESVPTKFGYLPARRAEPGQGRAGSTGGCWSYRPPVSTTTLHLPCPLASPLQGQGVNWTRCATNSAGLQYMSYISQPTLTLLFPPI